MNAYELAKAQQAYSPPTLEEIIKQQADLIKQASQFIQEQGLERQWIVWSTLKKASER